MVAKALIALLPSVAELERRAKTLAVLDCILSPETEYRYFTFDAAWSDTERMAKLDNGSGDTVYMVFSPKGAFVLGFDHESPMSPHAQDETKVWPGVLDAVPEEFHSFVEEPAFESSEFCTFCLWRGPEDTGWQCGEIAYPEGNADADGSRSLLSAYCKGAEGYVDFAEGYYEQKIPLDAVTQIFAFAPLDEKIARDLNPEVDWGVLQRQVWEIGYPIA